jgi:hypothetical protein
LQKLGRTTDPYQVARIGQMSIAIEGGKLWLESAAAKVRAFAPMFGGDVFSSRKKASVR